MADEPGTLQSEEILVLKSMYGEDFIETPPPKVWKGALTFPEFVLKIKHTDDDLADRVFCHLHVKFSKTYPRVSPTLQIQPPIIGLSALQVKELDTAVHAQAAKLVGSVMIFEIATLCQEFITSNNTASLAPSLAIEMNKRAIELEKRHQERAEEEANLIRQREEERAEQLAKQVRQRHEERLRAEKATRTVKASLVDLNSIDMAPSDVEIFEKEIELSPGISFNSVKLSNPRKECLGTTWVAEPMITGSGTSHPLNLHVISFDTPYYATNQGKKKLREVEKEIWRLAELHHPNLIRVYSVKLTGSDSSRLAILLEQQPPASLRDILYYSSELKPDRAVEYIGQILSALGAVHSFNITHKGLTVDCVGLLPSHVSDKHRVKLGRVGYYTRLLDLHRSNPLNVKLEEDHRLPDSWCPPEALKSPLEYPPSRDIWSLGVILLQMLLGLNVITTHSNYDEALSFSQVPLALQNFASSIFERKKKHLSCLQLLGLLPSVPIAHNAISAVPIRAIKSPEPTHFAFGSPERGYFGAHTPGRPSHQKSRYQEDWEEVEFLGKGGFGSVVKARNKIDNRIYAVKKVKLRASENDAKIFREVLTLSRLSHRYIVRYYTTWLETVDGTSSRADSNESDSDSSGAGTPVLRVSSVDDDDPFKIDLNDLKLSSRSRSTSFPSIHFGENSSSQLSNGDSSDSEDLDSPEQTTTFSQFMDDGVLSPHISRTLYIQMEFVESQTLKEAIEEGLSEDEAWRLFHQILEALAHMASLGVLHRDIKPTNIFLNAKGDVKIGDFGLATSSLAAVDPSDVSFEHDASDSDHTSHVGTSLYVAPEVLSSHRTRTLSKADMYSLGIVFFEMNWPVKTGSERIAVIQQLRKSPPIFPEGFKRVRQKEIILLLLKHNPADRPSAIELTKNPILPERLEDENFRDALRVMANTASPHYKPLLSALFSQPADLVKDLAYDIGTQLPEYATLNDLVQDRLAQCFRLHGAIHMEPSLLMPASGVDKDDNRIAIFLDKHGELVSLSRNLIISAARLAARTGTERIKRFHIGNTYRPEAGGGHPKCYKVAVFDIITPDNTLAADAETISIVNECLDLFPGVSDLQYEIHVSHANIIELMLGRVPAGQRRSVAEVLAQDRSSFPQKRAALLKLNVSRQIIDELEIMLDVDTIENIVSRLEKFQIWPSLISIVEEIKETTRLATLMGVTRRRILFRPWLDHKDLFKDGIVFEVVLRTKGSDVIAAGGRYDHLIRRFSAHPPSSIRALGVQIAMYRITRALADHQRASLKSLIKEQRSFGPWSPRRCDVYIVSFQVGFISERLEIATMLWQNEISADVMYDSALDMSEESHLSVCAKEGILFLVYQRQRSARRDQIVKVKSVLKATETEVHRMELVNYLQGQLAEQRRIDKIIASGQLPEPSQSIAVKEPSYDLQIILDTTNRKQKSRTREIYDRKAQAVAAELKHSLASGPPFVGIDVPSAAFSKMASSSAWLVDEDAFKSLLSEFPSIQNPSTTQVREAILKRKAEGHRFVYMFSLRDDKLHMFDLGP